MTIISRIKSLKLAKYSKYIHLIIISKMSLVYNLFYEKDAENDFSLDFLTLGIFFTFTNKY